MDPLATGVLVVAINQGTKIIEFLTYDDKEYIAEVKCGIKTDTLDIEGNILEQNNNYILNENEVIKVLNSFIGKYLQEVPKYSAIKVNGKRLYEYARNNIEVKLPKKEVEIKDIELINIKKDTFTFKVKVSKGTYIRSLIRDIGEKLNILCTMSNLRRINEGIFNIEKSYRLEDVNKDNYEIMSLKEALANYKQIEVNEDLCFKIKNGNRIKDIWNIDDIVVFTYENKVIGIYENNKGILKSRKIIV